MTTPIMVGSLSPDFNLPCTRIPDPNRQRAALADYRGQWLTLLFYPRDFSLVCPTELTAVSNRLAEFKHQGCEVLGISTDSVESHERWIRAPRAQGGLGGLNFPLASDLDGSVCRAYNVFVPYQKIAMRGLFIIDPNGVLQYQVVHNMSVGRRTEEILRVLAGLQTGGLCPENWSQEQTILDPTATLGPGSVLGQYRIEEVLGSGSFGSVYRALDTTLQRMVAVKVLKAGQAAGAMAALSEARAAAALNHPNICTIFAVDGSEGVPLIAMEYIAGRPLSKLLEKGPLPKDQAASVGRQIASGMAAAHAKGIIHGDLKPGNILVTPDGIAKIMDFGLARQDPRAMQTEETALLGNAEPDGISGTPSYMAPELVQGERPSPASDVFSLGLLLFEIISGQKAVSGENLMTVLRQLGNVDGAHMAGQVPEPFAGILRDVLIQDPRQRSVGMAAIADRLRS